MAGLSPVYMKFDGQHTWVERGTVRVNCLESSALTIRPPRLPVERVLVPILSLYENEISFTCKLNSFSYEWLCTKTRFEKEAKGDSEMAYCRQLSL